MRHNIIYIPDIYKTSGTKERWYASSLFENIYIINLEQNIYSSRTKRSGNKLCKLAGKLFTFSLLENYYQLNKMIAQVE